MKSSLVFLNINCRQLASDPFLTSNKPGLDACPTQDKASAHILVQWQDKDMMP